MPKSKKKVIVTKRRLPKKVNKKRKKVLKDDSAKYGTMSVEDFMSKSFEEEDDNESSSDTGSENLEAELSNKRPRLGEANVEDDIESDEEETNIDAVDYAEKHKESLAKLKETDPEFYKFLQDNDKKLLKFNLSDEEGDETEDEADQLHVPYSNLEVASDESDFETEDNEALRDSSTITLKLLKKWQIDIKTDKTNKMLNTISQAFHAALLTVLPDENAKECNFKVEGSPVFNAVIQLCVLEFGPAVRRFLRLAPGSKQQPHKCKRFIKVKNILKLYFENLVKLLAAVSSSNIQTILLKHLHYMSSMLTSFPHTTKSVIKQLIRIWGTAEEGVRIISFFCILRITRNNSTVFLDTVLKSMYMTYVKNSKFVSVSSLAAINFMRRSLVEMFGLDLTVAYQHVFMYIRQLAIHLRNAITVKKRENIQAVYNWQYVNSLKLWGNLLGLTSNKEQMPQLVYPFVQICLGTIRLVPTPQYYPLRFHITQIMIDLSRDADVFIPVLPFLIDLLIDYDFNKKHSKVSMKPMQFTCLLRLSKSQLGENGFKDTLIDTIYSQMLDYLNLQSSSIAFPELSIICIIRIKQFLKKCKNANYSRKLKQVLEKIEQNSKFIEKERQKFSVSLRDTKKIEGWERQIRNKGTPLSIYHESWSKIRNQKKRKEITNNEELADYKLPVLKKSNILSNKRKKDDKKEGPVELFPSDSEEETEAEIKRKRGKRGGKKFNKTDTIDSGNVVDDGEEDIVEDIDINDW